MMGNSVAASAGRFLDNGVELATPGLHQRDHAAEPLAHPRKLHRLAGDPLPGGEVLHLELGDDGEKATGGIGQNPKASDLLATRFIPYPPIELLEEGDQFIAAAVLSLK